MSSMDLVGRGTDLELLPCPLCGLELRQDHALGTARWRCPQSHGYSNVEALIADLCAAEAGGGPGSAAAGARARSRAGTETRAGA